MLTLSKTITMSTLIINATNPKDLTLLIELAKRLKISFKLVNDEKNRYNDKTEKSIKEARSGKELTEVTLDEFRKQLYE